MKVCHIITQLELGGAQQNTLYTLGHLDPARHELVLLCGRGGLLDAEAVQSARWRTMFVPGLVRPLNPWQDLRALLHLFRLLRREKPAIVHTHSSKAGILGRLAARLAGVPVIIHTYHGFGFTPVQSALVRAFYVAAERLAARWTTHVIFVSRDNMEEAKRLRIGTGLAQSLIRSGITMPPDAAGRPKGDIRAERLLPEDAWIVVSVGNFKPQKNPLDLVRVAKAVFEKDPAVYFLLVGDGPLRLETEDLAREIAVDERVHFLGWRRDIPALLAQANAFLLTSLWEGLPRALVEACAWGVPSVAYAVNGVRDILEDGVTGFPLAPGDYQAAAEKLLWIKRSPDAARAMAERAAERVRREFDIDKMVLDQAKLYADLYDRVPLAKS